LLLDIQSAYVVTVEGLLMLPADRLGRTLVAQALTVPLACCHSSIGWPGIRYSDTVIMV
jgi:hypothetical protein